MLWGVLVFPYLDNWLLSAVPKQEAEAPTSMLLNLLSSLGVSVNVEKSVLGPTKSLDFIGAIISSVTA